MANIKVHVLNFHGIFSHIEIVLENTSTDPHTYYGVNRWEGPKEKWSSYPKQNIEEASSVYSFDIEANPDDIVKRWKEYWHRTWKDAGILTQNCAVAAQWFLTEFAGIPKPSLSNVSWNHLAFGIVWPSFIPCPITLPGRIMSNAKFHIEAKTHPEVAEQYTRLFLYTSMALATLFFAASVFALVVAATVLTGGIAGVVIAGCAAVGIASTYAFFKAHNVLSAQNIAAESKKTDEQFPIMQDEPGFAKA
ncbi:Uncharacterised protein [Legionella steigerwaltii]|uniref:Transmembrane protein n=1 Tax=Legionella steigerwaltii TaxID=460 RepID=A0A378L8M5_9GAMM|nr:hypothetical protein [Legionella steigerwaltii]KTD77382.1 hypothetical protein Lstg_1739 [Legionella steigerwaltii]STY22262.1 Uncharacterised protein [Legionella steigerwaltii]